MWYYVNVILYHLTFVCQNFFKLYHLFYCVFVTSYKYIFHFWNNVFYVHTRKLWYLLSYSSIYFYFCSSNISSAHLRYLVSYLGIFISYLHAILFCCCTVICYSSSYLLFLFDHLHIVFVLFCYVPIELRFLQAVSISLLFIYLY